MNPCVRGYLIDPQMECACTPLRIERCHSRVSSPLVDRIDNQIEMPRLRYQELRANTPVKAQLSSVIA